MRARIHRGAREIGGSCVELEAAAGARLVLDLGLPLEEEDGALALMPAIRGLQTGENADLLGVVLSHSHPDHYGLIERIQPSVPLYMGEATEAILKEAAFFTPLGLDREVTKSLTDGELLPIGPFAVTPILVDHSAFGAYALLLEVDGQRLLYTGDIRGHGRKAAAFEDLLSHPPRDIDTLLLEGTTISRPVDPEVPASEEEVEARLLARCREVPGAVLACYSPQNVDRLVSVYRAAIRSGRDLVLDLYGASIAAATGRETIPQVDWERVRVFVPRSQAIAVKRSEQFWRVNGISSSRIYPEELAEDLSHWVISFRTSMARELADGGALTQAQAAWMMWAGYLQGESGERTRKEFERLGIELEVIHASGHAKVEDLQRLAKAISADRVVPIHTDAPERFYGLFERVEAHADGEWWEV
jgi:ribonuclease J